MIFKFDKQVFHTQYLAVMQSEKNILTNEYLYKSLIDAAGEENYRYLSFGTAICAGEMVLNRLELKTSIKVFN